ncbi:MAG: tRNA (adenosine(37)-N6)-threonylcarbamoyltransferase complex dimerization subunit type 1 TsaB [Candidatus Aminicenantes bacterium]
MLILAVDTTTSAGSMALLRDTDLLAELNVRSPLTHSETLLPAIDFLLRHHSLGIKDMDGFALAVGPGSFTGIRIGLSTIKSFSYASRKPVAPVSSLKALAFKLRFPKNRLIAPVIDAKKGEIYAALFESKREELAEVIPQGVYTPDGFFSRLPSHRVVHFIGNGVDGYKEKIFHYFKDKARIPRRSFYIGREIGLLGYELLRRRQGRDVHQVEPLYFRKSQAEEKN